jgi:hypothetical protein
MIPVRNKVISINRALYTLSDYPRLVECFTRVFSECGFSPQKSTGTEIAFFPGGIVDRVWSAYINGSVMNYSMGNFMEADVFYVRFLSSGNPMVTGLALRVSLKLRMFSEKKRREDAERFLSAVDRMFSEYSIRFVDYDAWDAFIAERPGLGGVCDWGGDFLFLASPKFKAQVVGAVKGESASRKG